MKNTYVYDTEGSGLQTRYDRPFQFAACTYDRNGNLIKTTNLRGRLPRYVLPDPAALLVTGQSINQIQSSPLSHYEFIEQVHADIMANAPAVVTSFNGIRYDEEILRHSFYANLRAPYVTQLDGNERMDVLVAAKAIAGISPRALNVPEGKDGKPSFKLEDLASVNGFSDHASHDALGDVEATTFLAQIMQKRAGTAWTECSKNRSKEHVINLLRSRDPLVHIGWSHEEGTYFHQVILPITPDQTNINEWLCVDLEADVDGILSLDEKDLVSAFIPRLGPSSVVRVKANALPMVFSIETAASLGIVLPVGSREANWIKADLSFPSRLRAAATMRKDDFEQTDDVWNQLYSGGFFPTQIDKPVFQRFHQASPIEKWELIQDMKDPRARYLARWLVGSEWPDVLSTVDRLGIEEEFREHLMNGQGSWTTIPSALTKIEELLKGATLFQIELLQQYKQYLINLLDTLAT
jgi:exodeoxyribonuclease-1